MITGLECAAGSAFLPFLWRWSSAAVGGPSHLRAAKAVGMVERGAAVRPGPRRETLGHCHRQTDGTSQACPRMTLHTVTLSREGWPEVTLGDCGEHAGC